MPSSAAIWRPVSASDGCASIRRRPASRSRSASAGSVATWRIAAAALATTVAVDGLFLVAALLAPKLSGLI